jgi:DHA1 family bicyclomycin/chloramphenicol resistance-like MFS transporter
MADTRERGRLARFVGLFLQAAMMNQTLATTRHVFIKLHGMPEQMYALLFGLNAIGMVGASVLNRRLLRSFSPAAILGAAVWGVLFAGILLAACA